MRRTLYIIYVYRQVGILTIRIYVHIVHTYTWKSGPMPRIDSHKGIYTEHTHIDDVRQGVPRGFTNI